MKMTPMSTTNLSSVGVNACGDVGGVGVGVGVGVGDVRDVDDDDGRDDFILDE